MRAAWLECPRADWLLWLVGRLGLGGYWCADLARLFAADALESAGMQEWAEKLRALAPVVDLASAAYAVADAAAYAADARAARHADMVRARVGADVVVSAWQAVGCSLGGA